MYLLNGRRFSAACEPEATLVFVAMKTRNELLLPSMPNITVSELYLTTCFQIPNSTTRMRQAANISINLLRTVFQNCISSRDGDSQKATIRRAQWPAGISGLYFFNNVVGHKIKVHGEHYSARINDLFVAEFVDIVESDLWFKQEVALHVIQPIYGTKLLMSALAPVVGLWRGLKDRTI